MFDVFFDVDDAQHVNQHQVVYEYVVECEDEQFKRNDGQHFEKEAVPAAQIVTPRLRQSVHQVPVMVPVAHVEIHDYLTRRIDTNHTAASQIQWRHFSKSLKGRLSLRNLLFLQQ